MNSIGQTIPVIHLHLEGKSEQRRPSYPGRVVHSTPPFSCLLLRTTPSCCSLRFCTFCCRHQPFRQVRVVHSTSPILCRPLRTTAVCRSLRFALFAANVDHPVRGVLCTVLRRSCAGDSKRRDLITAFGWALPALDVHHSSGGVLCIVLHYSCPGQSERRLLATTFASALPAALGVDHPV